MTRKPTNNSCNSLWQARYTWCHTLTWWLDSLTSRQTAGCTLDPSSDQRRDAWWSWWSLLHLDHPPWRLIALSHDHPGLSEDPRHRRSTGRRTWCLTWRGSTWSCSCSHLAACKSQCPSWSRKSCPQRHPHLISRQRTRKTREWPLGTSHKCASSWWYPAPVQDLHQHSKVLSWKARQKLPHVHYRRK